MRPLRWLKTIASSVIAIGLALMLCEIGVRWLDSQPLSALILPPPMNPPASAPVRLDPQMGGSLPTEIDPEWIASDPPPFPPPPTDPALAQRVRTWRDPEIRFYETFRIWNRSMVRSRGCQPGSIFSRLPQPILVFDAPDPHGQPPHRYLPSLTLPGGLMTNRFGWRGADVPLDKPANTIRLAFVGASTTVGLWFIPFSYPEYVVHWLNLWAEHAGLSVRFDGINAGREGMGSQAIAAVVADELTPLEPDVVVYYEGANQSLCYARVDAPPPPPKSNVRQALDGLVRWTRPYSQSARRMEELLQRVDARDGAESVKPQFTETWFPAGLDEANPDISGQTLPKAEGAILQDLDDMRDRLAASHTTLVLSSFVWLVDEGLQLDVLRDRGPYWMLNGKCWPHTYRDLRRAADLHNRILQRYAALHAVPFIDVAAQFPKDPALFFDAIHLGPDGTRAHAWLVFRALVPLVRSRLESGAWPQPDRAPLSEHPNIKPAEPYVVRCDATPTAPTRATPTTSNARTDFSKSKPVALFVAPPIRISVPSVA